MMHGCKNFIKGIALGLTTAAAVTMIIKTKQSSGNKRKLKRSATRAIHALGDIVDNVQNIVMP